MLVSELNVILSAHPDYSVGISLYAPVWVQEGIGVLSMDFKPMNECFMAIHITGKKGKNGYENAAQMLEDTSKCYDKAVVTYYHENGHEYYARVRVSDSCKTIDIY